ncbi:unnamed protein product [Mytilus edulis]|nr:unnamed protein product [Mytilus edulis]
MLFVFLENSIADQSNIDNMYENFVKIVKTEMCNKLPAKNIVLSNGFNINKRRRCKKEWWNEELTLLWNEVCKAEKVWIKCKIKRNKRELRHIFVNKRRIFDKAVQSSKRKYWYSLQEDLIKSCDNPKEFWRKIGKIGVGSERRSFIPMEVKLSDESVSCDKNVVLDKWKCEFSNMLNRNNLNNVEYIHSNENVYDDYLDSFISYEEVYNVLLSSKNGKSPGCDEITVELYKNQTALLALTRIFNICFDSGKIPALWSKGIITPIPKSSTADPRDPMAYRGITLAPVSYKLYCGVLNSRLTVKLDELNFLHDEQNGFRKGRNTIDHISTLTTVIETRKLRKLSTFVAFIDFKKAYDWINRDLLFGKLENLVIPTLAEDSTDDKVPIEIKLMTDKKSVPLYLKLLESGSEKKRDIRLVIVGKKGAGKTSLLKRLFGEEIHNRELTSTNGIEIHRIRCNANYDDSEWNKLDG